MPQKSIVQCAAGHLYTATWIPFVGFKSLRLTPSKRYARCPVGKHWAVVSRPDQSTLTEEQLAAARSHDAGWM
ncbi:MULTISPECIES: hypothetical protein [unclassified Streptomyces]|uniref:hypothetical protein n=1 Tax=unclassified Streptomyces TaxID=2593676 RepID=UPI002E810E46|nr:hypothetical protein [Streptomyces sp. NBC_00589]WTI38507.1 hypothetical protein OIC96_27725 [Streptomyces sp. NBC_00775]WUB27814.1 hypothetical protein OHA51_22010 [Streptomyces sp. NBC_00589]